MHEARIFVYIDITQIQILPVCCGGVLNDEGDGSWNVYIYIYIYTNIYIYIYIHKCKGWTLEPTANPGGDMPAVLLFNGYATVNIRGCDI